MKICKVFHSDYPWEVRVEKILNALIEKHHEVHLVCGNLKKRKKMEDINGLKIHRLPFFNNSLLSNTLTFPAFFNPIWLYSICKVVKENNIDIIMIRDLPLALASIFIGRLLNIPVIYDMAENYPAMWKISSSIIKNPFIAHKMEDIAMRLVDKILVVVDESKDRLIKKGVPENKISIVSNTPDLRRYNNKVIMIKNDKLNLIYVGYIMKERGIDTVLKALPTIIGKFKKVHFNILGEGKYITQLRDLVRNLNLNDYVNFLGWVEPHDLPIYIHQCDVGVIPHYVTDQTNTTIPNKLFDFMACAKPVIVSDATPLKRIVTEDNCGVVFKSGNHEDFAIKFLKLTDSLKRTEMGNNGQRAVKNKYNWKNDAKTLYSIINKIKINSRDQ